MSELRINNTERLQGFIRLELYDKDGNLKTVKEHNMLTNAGKSLMLQMSAGALLDMNDVYWGYLAKQGASMVTWNNGTTYTKLTKKSSALTNVLLSLTPEQYTSINSETSFINIFDSTFTNPEKVLGYANMSTQPTANGKEGSLEYQKGADVVSNVVYSKKFRYPDGVATGTINAVAMMPFCAINTPYGASGSADQYAPGFRMAKCLDRVNFRNTNFGAFTTGFCPPGVTGITSETEVISNYSMDGITQHKIDLVTGEVTDITTADNTIPMMISTANDYYIEDDYLYILTRTGQTTSLSSNLTVYQISTKTQVLSATLATRHNCFQRFVSIDGVLYINGISYNPTGNVLFKLKKGSNPYWSAIDTSATDYSALFTVPSNLSPYMICFGNYGDKYIMYIARDYGTKTTNRDYASAYIFTDPSDVIGSIIDCIPSVRYTDIVFKNASVGGVLSIGIERDATSVTDSIYQTSITTSDDTEDKKVDFKTNGLFYSNESSWSNMISIAILNDDDIIEKGATDVLFVAYGYRVK